MILRIARKELLDTTRGGRFRVRAALVLTVSMTSLVAGWKHYRDVQQQHAEAQRATRGQWLDQGQKNPHSAAHYGVYAFKPKNRLSMVDTGIDPHVGVAAWLEAHKQNEFKYRPAQDRTAVQRFGSSQRPRASSSCCRSSSSWIRSEDARFDELLRCCGFAVHGRESWE